MKRYQCRHVVEAMQWNGTDANRAAFCDWFDLQGAVFETRGPVIVLPGECGEAAPGEWVLFSDGEFIVMDDESFRDTYRDAP